MKRPAVAAGLALLAALVAWGWLRLRMEADILATLPPSLPEVKSLKLLRDGFAGGSDLLVAVEGGDAAATTTAIRELALRLQARTDLVRHVRWAQSLEAETGAGPELLAWSLQNTDPARLAALRMDLDGDAAKARLETSIEVLANSPDVSRVQRVSYDPFGLLECLESDAIESIGGSLFSLNSPDGTLGVLLVTPASEIGNYKSASPWLDAVKAEVASLNLGGAIVSFTGEPAFQSEIGGGIERDMSGTVVFTQLFIAVLFWIVFRRIKPLLWVQLLLVLSLALTLGLGGLLVGKLSIMSLGFAAVVLGIVVDYAALIIQEARVHPAASPAELRRRAAPGILAGAGTTAVVFLSLMLSGLPGLAELGLLVALGVVAGLAVMLGLVPELAAGKQAAQTDTATGDGRGGSHRWAGAGTVLLFGGMISTLAWRGFPRFEPGAEALRPTKSIAADVWHHVQQKLGRADEASVAVIVTAPEAEVRARLRALESAVVRASKADRFHSAMPTLLAPDPSAQSANRPTIEWLLRELPRLEREAVAAGFTEDALGLLRGVAETWRDALTKPWPQDSPGPSAAPVLDCVISTGVRARAAGLAPGEAAALGSVCVPGSPDRPDPVALDEIQSLVGSVPGVSIAGWETLGGALAAVVRKDFARQLVPILAVLALTLFLTFRNLRDLLLASALLAAGLGAVAATMSAFGQSWNLASLAAIPLLLGTGIDYGIHLLLAMKQHGNSIARARATTGRAVFFAGATTLIGFGSLCFAGNQGIASLGLACCLGIGWILLIALWLLPHWRVWLSGK